MKKGIFVLAMVFANSTWANGKATVLKYDDASQTPHVQSCRLYYEHSAMTVDQVLQMLKTNPALATSLQEHLGLKNGNVEQVLTKKTAAYLKDNKMKAGDCSKVKMNDLFQGVAAMKSCKKLETLTAAMNKIPMSPDQVALGSVCSPEKAGDRLPASVPSK